MSTTSLLSPTALLARAKRLLRSEPKSRTDLLERLRDAEKSNVIDPDTLIMLEGALQLYEMKVRDIMVPRSQMVAVVEDDDPEDFLPTAIESSHSRFPVLDKDKKEQVVGILLAKDLLPLITEASPRRFNFKDALRPAVFVPESKRLNMLLRDFRSSRNHLAIVVDEYGNVSGLVSIEDVIEQIVGEIDDEHDVNEDSFVKTHGGNRYTVKAQMPIADFNAQFGTQFSDASVDTIGGLVLQELGHLPKRGERLQHGGLSFLVLRADRRRIHTLRVLRTPPARSEATTPATPPAA